MSDYSCEKKLPSCSVEKKLLSDLERYIIDKSKHLGFPEARYSFSLSDSTGEEVMNSVDEFKFHYFPDSTKDITLDLSSRPTVEGRLTIQIKFRSAEALLAWPQARITFSGNNSREIASGLLTEILHIIEPYRTWNAVFLIPAWLMILSVVWFVSWGMLISGASHQDMSGFIKSSLIGGSVILLGVLYSVMSRVKPYTIFQTRLNERRSKIGGYIIALFISLLAAVIYGLITNK